MSKLTEASPADRHRELSATADLFLHAWDLARASGQELDLDADSATAMHAGLSVMGPALQASGQFGPPVPVAANDSPQRKLIGLIGRDPSWQTALAPGHSS